MTIAVNERAVIGGNNPPVPMTAFDAVKMDIDDLCEEANVWLDGEQVTTQEQADAINTLIDRIMKAANAADAQRGIEKEPHDTAIDEIQGRYNKLIAGVFSKNKSVTGSAKLAIDAAKKALAPYLLKQEQEQAQIARLARVEADRLQEQAREAMRQRDSANLSQVAEAESLVVQAKAATKFADKAEGTRIHAKGEGRAIGLRTVHRAVMEDKKLAAAWVWVDRQDELTAFIQDLADKAVRSGTRTIPGFSIIEEKVL
jgi:hypothetical protein